MICPKLLKNFISSYVKTAFTECLCDNLAHRLRRTNDVNCQGIWKTSMCKTLYHKSAFRVRRE